MKFLLILIEILVFIEKFICYGMLVAGIMGVTLGINDVYQDETIIASGICISFAIIMYIERIYMLEIHLILRDLYN